MIELTILFYELKQKNHACIDKLLPGLEKTKDIEITLRMHERENCIMNPVGESQHSCQNITLGAHSSPTKQETLSIYLLYIKSKHCPSAPVHQLCM